MKLVFAEFNRHAIENPSHDAVADGHKSLSYSELNHAARHLAKKLQQLGTEDSESVVGFFGPVGIDLVVALLAAHLVGQPFVFIDPDLPDASVIDLVKHVGVNNFVSNAENIHRCKKLLQVEPIVAAHDTQNQILPIGKIQIHEQSISHIRYTSGSTGNSKGVPLTRQHVARMLVVFNELIESGASDRIGLYGHFWPLVIFYALSNGATLDCFHFAKDGPAVLCDWMVERRITMMFTYPVLYRQFVAAAKHRFPDLRFVHLSGEAVCRDDIRQFEATCCSHAMLQNSYGSSEYPWIASYFHRPGEPMPHAVVPLGRPVPPARVHLVDEDGSEVATGEPGEIVVEAADLPDGYWKNAERSAHVFRVDLDNPSKKRYHTGDLAYRDEQGLLHGIGRKDDQVKIRGFVVIPAQIEQLLREHESVEDAAILPYPNNAGELRLACHFSALDVVPKTHDLRLFLASQIPRHMIPTVFHAHKGLPRTATGKLDRRALQDFHAQQSKLRPSIVSKDATEQTLIRIWQSVLGHSDFGRLDDFFDVGGDSLSAMSMLAQIEHSFGHRLPLDVVYVQGATIDSLSNFVSQNEPMSYLAPLKIGGSRPPLVITHLAPGHFADYLPLVELLSPNLPVLGLHPRGLRQGDRCGNSIESLAAHGANECQRHGIRSSRWSIAGYSFGALTAFEMAKALKEQGRAPERLFLIDPPARIIKRIRIWRLIRDSLQPLDVRQLVQRLLFVAPRLFGIPSLSKSMDHAHLAAAYRYRPVPLTIPNTFIFVSKENPDRDRIISEWTHLLEDEVQILNTPGDHLSMMQPPSVQALANSLNQLLITNAI